MGLLMVKNIMFAISFTEAYQGKINVLAAITIIVAFIWALNEIVKDRLLMIFIPLFALTIFIMLQLILYPEDNMFFISNIPRIVFFGAIPFLLLIAASDYDALLRMFRMCSYIILGFGMISICIQYMTRELHSAEYSMSFGGCIGFGVVIIEHYMMQEKKLRDILLFIAGVLAIILAGSRGPFLGIAFYFAFHILFLKSHKGIREIAVNGAIIAVVILFYRNYMRMVTSLAMFLELKGIRSRTLLLLLNDRAMQDSGRHEVYAYSKNLLLQHPVMGVGYDGLMANGYAEMTPHNTYLEFVLYYGIFVGGACLICLAFLWIRGLFANRGTGINFLCIIFFSLYVPRSFVGAGSLEAPTFWLLLGASIASVRISQIRKRNRQLETDRKGDVCVKR